VAAAQAALTADMRELQQAHDYQNWAWAKDVKEALDGKRPEEAFVMGALNEVLYGAPEAIQRNEAERNGSQTQQLEYLQTSQAMQEANPGAYANGQMLVQILEAGTMGKNIFSAVKNAPLELLEDSGKYLQKVVVDEGAGKAQDIFWRRLYPKA